MTEKNQCTLSCKSATQVKVHSRLLRVRNFAIEHAVSFIAFLSGFVLKDSLNFEIISTKKCSLSGHILGPPEGLRPLGVDCRSRVDSKVERQTAVFTDRRAGWNSNVDYKIFRSLAFSIEVQDILFIFQEFSSQEVRKFIYLSKISNFSYF